MPNLVQALRFHAVESISPAGNSYCQLSLAAARSLAEQFSLSIKEVEIAALENGIIPERYERNLGTTGGAEGQILLLNSRVAVVGLGGLGGLAAVLLARMGIGSLVLIDGDSFSESNLNRQILATEANLQQKKADIAQKTIAQINAAVETSVFREMAGEDDLKGLLAGCQLALDCLDNLKTRFLLQAVCQETGIPMIHGAIAQFYGQVLTIFPGDPGLRVVYSYFQQGQDKEERGIEKELGNPAATPALVAAWQVQETIKVLLKKGNPLRNRLLFMDTLQGNCEIIPLGE